MNGHKFTVKPKSLLARKIDKELKDEMKEWQEKNNKDFTDFIKKYGDKLVEKDIGALPDDIPESKDWMEDVEFRARRWKKMADACMDFKKPVPSSLWKSEEIEYGMIELAWDFFTGERKIPMDISIR